jgi:hypothetical protein
MRWSGPARWPETCQMRCGEVWVARMTDDAQQAVLGHWAGSSSVSTLREQTTHERPRAAQAPDRLTQSARSRPAGSGSRQTRQGRSSRNWLTRSIVTGMAPGWIWSKGTPLRKFAPAASRRSACRASSEMISPKLHYCRGTKPPAVVNTPSSMAKVVRLVGSLQKPGVQIQDPVPFNSAFTRP